MPVLSAKRPPIKGFPVAVANMLIEGKEANYLGGTWSGMSLLDGSTAADRDELLRTDGNPDGMRASFRHHAAMREDGKADCAAFHDKRTVPVPVLNDEGNIFQEQTPATAWRLFATVQHDTVPQAGHTFAADRPDWTADRIKRFFAPAARQGGEGQA